MERESQNIYYNARRAAGLTQERWSEMLGCSPDSVRNYEAGTQTPSDSIVKAMCEIAGNPALAYWHLCRKSPLAAETLPDVEQLPLPQAAIQMLLALEDFTAVNGDLIRLAADGRISSDEAQDWEGIVKRLDGIIQAAIQVKIAEGGA